LCFKNIQKFSSWSASVHHSNFHNTLNSYSSWLGVTFCRETWTPLRLTISSYDAYTAIP